MTTLRPYLADSSSSPLQIADAMREIVLESESGALLGSEDELVAQFGVSRPTFRQAARILEAEGLLAVRRGVNGGLFARQPAAAGVAKSVSVLLRHRGVTFADVTRTVHALMGELARQAAAHPRKAERARQAKAIRAYVPSEDLTEPQRVVVAGVQFSQCVSELATNPVVFVMLDILLDLLSQQPDAPTMKGHYGDLRSFHLAVADAIESGDQVAVLVQCSDFQRRLEHWRI
jgi:GntR family transcriptional repressor for pyruvate dehydrogenase complex